ncbi:hypothetical protein DFP72DRAFT_388589 [Ephemerocybe angulata]|uniref:Uncharacterized protein n=1 Tax=Ephemerocybe angulata TaxID=980116 RepID=A0A8H6HWY6_9AGAR|nr:hypothetical protein DFP72DRAFT_388589 [Tulosesus angulatus]
MRARAIQELLCAVSVGLRGLGLAWIHKPMSQYEPWPQRLVCNSQHTYLRTGSSNRVPRIIILKEILRIVSVFILSHSISALSF